ncbi:RlpA-like double-psi beta-barrel-protein domain-containing protein-containing protein [Syncephalastrum racemosum]|uniref:RlpA-like double-psi beta-barrel-protein domain-containing protein-containing protein n=1 Tax=Syncephalastrum racemosum TaxID=13706 RepID=A0A1X2H1K3_SYNRA|nr:RlpA-like double-psi beta-barrel-protein domain-containing protein-containing protein [Syncephalastrum racemosum]
MFYNKSIFALVCAFLLAAISQVNAAPLLQRRSKSYSGDGTFYTVGLGSCGKTNKDSDKVVALSSSLMSSGDLCGKKIKAKGPEGTVTATVVDTCPSCAEGDVDFSQGAFTEIGTVDAGRVSITWSIQG